MTWEELLAAFLVAACHVSLLEHPASAFEIADPRVVVASVLRAPFNPWPADRLFYFPFEGRRS